MEMFKISENLIISGYKNSKAVKVIYYIDALNSNKKDMSTDEVVADYCKANKDKISISNNIVNKDHKSRTYKLKDGSDITFTDENFFVISSLKEEVNKNKATLSTSKATLLASGYSSTPSITVQASAYSAFGVNMFTLYTRGYFDYNSKTVIPHLTMHGM